MNKKKRNKPGIPILAEGKKITSYEDMEKVKPKEYELINRKTK